MGCKHDWVNVYGSAPTYVYCRKCFKTEIATCNDDLDIIIGKKKQTKQSTLF